MHVGWRRIGDLRVALHQDANLAFFPHGCCAAATEPGRPTLMGSTMPGNNTVLRTARMMHASDGNGGIAGASVDLARPASASAMTHLNLSR